MSSFGRIWTGIVAAVAGAALALVAQIAGQIAIGLPVSYLVPVVITFSSIGFVLGVAISPRKV